MRTVICTDYHDKLKKLVLVHETDNGVYLAFCDKTADIHVSYHTDGTHHVKQKGKNVRAELPAGPGIQDIEYKQQIIGHTVIYCDNTIERLAPFKTRKRDKAIIVLSHAVFERINALSLNSYIVRADMETRFFAEMYESYQDDSFDLVSVSTFTLEYFPSHKVALIFYRGKGEWDPGSTD